jgi:tRNA-2-methylthio-N6-dimethylallyladenosine synthase
MNRGYTSGHYLERVRKARERMPAVSLTTDIMVGYPGETEEDFQDTIKLVKEVRFDEAYTYAYSSRSGTAAADHPETVPEDEKFRNRELTTFSAESRSRSPGHGRLDRGVFPEKRARSAGEWMGRTPGGHGRLGRTAPGIPCGSRRIMQRYT